MRDIVEDLRGCGCCRSGDGAEEIERLRASAVSQQADREALELVINCRDSEAKRREAEIADYLTRLQVAHEERERLRARRRDTCQILVEAVGADGPCNAEDAAKRALAELRRLRARRPVVCGRCQGLAVLGYDETEHACPDCGTDGCGPGVRWSDG